MKALVLLVVLAAAACSGDGTSSSDVVDAGPNCAIDAAPAFCTCGVVVDPVCREPNGDLRFTCAPCGVDAGRP